MKGLTKIEERSVFSFATSNFKALLSAGRKKIISWRWAGFASLRLTGVNLFLVFELHVNCSACLAVRFWRNPQDAFHIMPRHPCRGIIVVVWIVGKTVVRFACLVIARCRTVEGWCLESLQDWNVFAVAVVSARVIDFHVCQTKNEDFWCRKLELCTVLRWNCAALNGPAEALFQAAIAKLCSPQLKFFFWPAI